MTHNQSGMDTSVSAKKDAMLKEDLDEQGLVDFTNF